jgi:peptide-methionine (R)-S-oxide reductase
MSHDLKKRSSDEQYRVTQQKGTESAFTGRYVDHHEDGTYETCQTFLVLQRRFAT